MSMSREERIARADEIFESIEENRRYLKRAQEVASAAKDAVRNANTFRVNLNRRGVS